MYGHYRNKYGNVHVNFYVLIVLLSRGREIYFPFFVNYTEVNPAVQETRYSSLSFPDTERV